LDVDVAADRRSHDRIKTRADIADGAKTYNSPGLKHHRICPFGFKTTGDVNAPAIELYPAVGHKPVGSFGSDIQRTG
jgi:hypothetical protein